MASALIRSVALATVSLALACDGDDVVPASCPAPPALRCAAASSTPELAVVSVLTVETPVAGALVLTHRADGTTIARGHTDAEGCAQVASEPGALLTVAGTARVTTTAPSSDRRTVRMPAIPGAECATSVRIDVLNPRTLGERDRERTFSASAGCDRYECSEAISPSEPFEIAIPGHLIGSDGLVHVWIRECVSSIDQFQNYVTTCQDVQALTAPHGTQAVTLDGAPAVFNSAGGYVEADGQIFPALVTETSVTTPTGVPFDHATRISYASTSEFHRGMHQRWGTGETRPPEPGPDDYLPTFDGGAVLDDARTLRLPAPPYAADSIVTRLFIGEVIWHVMLPAGQPPVTMPEDPELPGPLVAGTVNAIIVDDEDHADHEALIAGGIYLGNPNNASFIDIRGARRWRDTRSRPPE